jgi:dTDP-4-amino-4,6-dideoxygalactose transaminase
MRVTHHQYWIRCPRRRQLRDLLAGHGIETGVYYDPTMQHHELAEYCRVAGGLPEAERAAKEILILPIHSAMPFEHAQKVGEIVKGFLQDEAATARS